jgi:hypothetical protein
MLCGHIIPPYDIIIYLMFRGTLTPKDTLIMEVSIIVAVIIVATVLAVIGGYQTVKRNWILAILLFLFFSPLWLIWAYVELFLPEPLHPFKIQTYNNKDQ